MANTPNNDAPADTFYLECSLPNDLTIAAYRRLRPRRRSLWQQLLGRRPWQLASA
jgi:hypothetical protein